MAYLAKKLYPEALAEFQKATELSGRSRRSLACLCFALGIYGKRDEALAILKELQSKYEKHEAVAQDLATGYAGLGDKDQAFAWLEKGIQDRSGQMAELDGNRSSNRFAAIRAIRRF